MANKSKGSDNPPKKRRKSPRGAAPPAAVDNDDANSVDTARQSGNPTNLYYRKNILFCDITLRVKPAKKGTEELRTQCQTLLRVLQDADDSVLLLKYKTEAGGKNEHGEWKVGKAVSIMQKEEIPPTITALAQYFHRARPYSAGGNVYTKVKLAFDGDFDTLRLDVDHELMELGFKIYPQKLQHHDVKQVGFLHLFHPESNLEFWTGFFCELLTTKMRKETKIGLASRFLYDGQKAEKGRKKSSRVRAVHLEVVASQEYDVTRKIKEILKERLFKSMYGQSVRLVPLYDREQSLEFNSKVRRLMVQHGQGIQCMAKGTNYEISYLDEVEKTTELTLRQMIIGLRSRDDEQLFFTVDESWNRQGFSLYWAVSREEEARLMQVHLGAALVRQYGNAAKKFFSVEEQRRIDETTWTEEGIPQAAVDVELDEVLEEVEGIEWINMEAVEALNEEATLPTGGKVAQSHEVLDTDSISTFGSRLISPVRPRTTRVHTEEEVSVITMDTRVSQMEQHMMDLGSNMQRLMELMQAGRVANPEGGAHQGAEEARSLTHGL